MAPKTKDKLIAALQSPVQEVINAPSAQDMLTQYQAGAEISKPREVNMSIIPKHVDVNPFANENKGFYSTMYDTMFAGGRPETEQEKAKRERRERANMNISALGDSLAHVANIWGATQGATPARLSSLAGAQRARYDYADRLRRDNEQSWKRGAYQARIADMSTRKQEQANKAAIEQANRNYAYKIYRDEVADEQKANKQLYDEEQAAKLWDYKTKILNETQRSNKVKESISSMNAATSRERNAILRENKANGKPTKTVSFALSDGKAIDVPESLKNDYIADVFDVLSKSVQKSGDINDINMLKYNELGMIPRSTTQRDAVHILAKKYPEVEKYMKERAEQYNMQSDTSASDVSEEEESGFDWSEIIPNM